MNTTTVINIRDAPEGWESNPEFVYIGREQKRGNYNLDGSIFANPFVVGRNGERGECVDLYKERLFETPELFMKARENLRGKILVCWCAPRRCHGDVLADLANGVTDPSSCGAPA